MRAKTVRLSNKELEKKLAALPAEKLASALVEIRFLSDTVEAAIERLLSGPQERVERFHTRLQTYLPGRDRPDYVPPSELEGLLLELDDPDIDPTDGFQALLAFFQADQSLLEAYDDSGGSVGFLYDYTAPMLLAKFASRLEPSFVVESLGQLLSEDEYGVRISIVKKAEDFLSEANLRAFFARLRQNRDQSEDHMTALYLEEPAKQLADEELLEQLLRERQGQLKTSDYITLAKVSFQKRDYRKALDFLQADPEKKALEDYKGEAMRIECLKQLGQAAELQIAAWQRFASYPCPDRFQELVEQVGEDKRHALEEKAIELISGEEDFRTLSALLLVSLGKEERAEEYVLSRTDQLEDAFFGDLSKLAEKLRGMKKFLASTQCYRALLNDILNSGRSKAYHHAADYFRALSEMSKSVTDWRGVPTHSAYLGTLKAKHGRKTGFWGRG